MTETRPRLAVTPKGHVLRWNMEKRPSGATAKRGCFVNVNPPLAHPVAHQKHRPDFGPPLDRRCRIRLGRMCSRCESCFGRSKASALPKQAQSPRRSAKRPSKRWRRWIALPPPVRGSSARMMKVIHRLLKTIPDPPLVLYVKGNAGAARSARRRHRRQPQVLQLLRPRTGRALRRAAGGAGFTVISGGARGVDSAPPIAARCRIRKGARSPFSAAA
jgi:hypothetical protein